MDSPPYSPPDHLLEPAKNGDGGDMAINTTDIGSLVRKQVSDSLLGGLQPLPCITQFCADFGECFLDGGGSVRRSDGNLIQVADHGGRTGLGCHETLVGKESHRFADRVRRRTERASELTISRQLLAGPVLAGGDALP